MAAKIDGKFVTVGDYIGEEMEYIPVDSTKIYERNGKLYAAVTGIVRVNPLKRTVSIIESWKPKRKPIKPGDVVIGIVEIVRRFTVGVRIMAINGRYIFDNKTLYGNIHVSNVASSYIEKIADVFKKTDVVRARVLLQTGRHS